MRKILLPATLAITTSFAALSHANSTVAFDWFSYEGKDPVFETPLPEGQFQNPILAGFYPDPTSVRVGDDFYAVSSSFTFFPGLPIFHSTDLVNWNQIGHILDRPSQLTGTEGLAASRAIFAPTLRYHESVFYLICTSVDRIGNFYVTATDPAGPAELSHRDVSPIGRRARLTTLLRKHPRKYASQQTHRARVRVLLFQQDP